MTDFDPIDTSRITAFELEATAKERMAERIEVDDVKWLMGSEQGRRIMHRLLAQARLWQSTFSADAMVMAWCEGRREIGMALWASITAQCPDLYLQMMKENTNG